VVELRDLRTFLVCARLQHFTRAADALAYAQSTVTAQVKSLEAELGVPLFDRIGRRVVLTAAGVTLADHATLIIEMADQAVAAVAATGAQPAGDLTIAATETLSTYRLPDVLRAYQDHHPDVRLFLRPDDPARLLQLVAEGEVPIAITLDRPVTNPDLHVTALADEPVLLLAPPGHPLCDRTTVRPSDLDGQRLLLSELGVSYGGAFLDALAAAGVRPERPMAFSSVAAIKQCVRAGMGLTVLPAFACQDEVAAGQLVPLPLPCPPVTVQIVRHRDRWVPPAAQALVDLATTMLGPPPRP
jgi:DNA-binding transcriptional LysR family regulator